MCLEKKIINKTAKVAVMGLGYVGLPLALAFAESGFETIGFDPQKNKIDLLKKGLSDIADVSSDKVKKMIRNGSLRVSEKPSVLEEADAILICVPTPLTESMEPDVQYIQEAVSAIAEFAKEEVFVSLESTTYPGTTQELICNPLVESGYVLGKTLFVCYSPERVDPGNKKYTTQNTPKVLGGIDTQSRLLGEYLYNRIIEQVIPVTSVEVAEMSKLLENSFRSINIAFINEMASLADKLNINIWETIEASSSKPFGFMKFTPGPGVGGHCIPLDPMYLYWKAKSKNFYSHFIELSHEINHLMPEKMLDYSTQALSTHGKSVRKAKILLLGVAYKENSNDLRESPAIELYQLLEQSGAKVEFCDPLADEFVDSAGVVQKSIQLNYDLISNYDLVILLTPHKIFNLEKIGQHSRLILDTKNVLGDCFSNKKMTYGRFQETRDALLSINYG